MDYGIINNFNKNRNMKKLYLLLILFGFIFNVFGQHFDASPETLEISGSLEAKDKSNWELADCIANFAMSVVVTSYTESESDSFKSSYVNGDHSYAYFSK